MMRQDFKNEWRIWRRIRSTILVVVLMSSVCSAFLWHAGFPCLAIIVSAASMGWIVVHWISSVRIGLSTNHLIVVTGCDSGLGFSLALHCRRLGAVVIAGVLQQDGPGAAKLREHGVLTRSLDITKAESVEDFETYVRTAIDQKNLVLAALVNNAGVMIFGEFHWQTEAQMRYQVEVNLLGTMRLTRALMPIILTDTSRIVVITSHCSSEPLPGVAVYGATKAGIHGWATALRVELRKYGVDVVTFVPGSFTKESNILAQQKEHFDRMRAAMNPGAKDFYGDYFERYAAYLTPISRKVESQELLNPRIYENFEGALLDRYPSAIYKCEPWRYFFYHALFKISPTRVRDRLIEIFIQMPSWNDKRRRRGIINDEKSIGDVPSDSGPEILSVAKSEPADDFGIPTGDEIGRRRE